MSDDATVLDEALLRVIARRLGSLTRIESVAVFPAETQESVVATIDSAYYPDAVQQVALEVRAYQNGEFHITYREQWESRDWMCRWDRHENPHNDRDHFHKPPAARASDAVDREYPIDLFTVLTAVLTELDERVGEVWAAEDR